MEWTSGQTRRAFGVFAWLVLAYNIPVILWGAYVRVSFSGDGCGAHWPFCNGEVIPRNMATPMAIEFTHRMMTGLDSVAVIALCVWAFLSFPRRHAVRLFSSLSLGFLLVEALLGAGLVLLRYVAHDQSAGRAFYLSAHLTNTMLLLAALAITAWLVYAGADRIRWPGISRRLWGAALAVVAVSITGAVAALGDTLFPASSLALGMQRDFSSASSLLLRLRLIHPFLAVAGAGYLIWVAVLLLRGTDEEPRRRAPARVITLTLLQLAVGAVNITLLAPVWMQLVHLFMADILWIAVVLMVMEAGRPERLKISPPGASYAALRGGAL
ncbi:MAG TPA: COX15/CtaA family protein [Bryobacteraceae bacterium]|jgi:heme A synthase|nr:COX15/CtaA family protein [Bryobacteraceae bacterium]